LRDEKGFTLIEIAVVLGVVALLVAVTVPNITAYMTRQEARGRAQQIADAIGTARSSAIREGNNYFVLFHAPSTGSVTIVDDDNNDWQVSTGETVTVIDRDAWTDANVTPYGELSSPPAATRVPEDTPGTIPTSSPSIGATFPVDGGSGNPAVGFNSRGVPVDLNSPTVWGSGQGSFYVTDNDQAVYAVTLLPLGGTRLRAYRPDDGVWY
jgi:prepilin-type N-terminal cleavage/methylation domain-containing protein